MHFGKFDTFSGVCTYPRLYYLSDFHTVENACTHHFDYLSIHKITEEALRWKDHSDNAWPLWNSEAVLRMRNLLR